MTSRRRAIARVALAGFLASVALIYADANFATAYTLHGAKWCDRWASVVHAEPPTNALPGYPVANAAFIWNNVYPTDQFYKINFDYYVYSSGNTRIQSWTRSDGLNGTVASAVWYYTPWDGCMQSGGKMFFNTSYGWNTRGDACNGSTSWYHQETAALHELGHLLGLGHSAYDQAVMYANLPVCTYRALDGDDMWGGTTIYGKRLR